MPEQESRDNVDEAIERLFDSLADLNRVQKRRESLENSDPISIAEEIENGDTVEEFWEPADRAQLEFALRHLDAAKEYVEEELDRVTPDDHRTSK